MRRSLLTLSILLSAFFAGHAQTQEDMRRKAMNHLCSSFTHAGVDEAINNAHTAVEFQPELAAGYFRLAQLYESKKDFTTAEVNYRKALEATLINRGRMKADEGKFAEAIADFTAAIDMTRQNIPKREKNFRTNLSYLALYHRGLAHAEKDEYERAFEDWMSAVEWYPGFAEAYYNMGLLRNLRGDTDAAIRDTLRALELKKDYRDASVSLGFFYQKQGKWDKAAEAYWEALKYSKDDVDLIHLRGVALLEDNREQDALPLLRQASAARPEDATFLSDFAAALMRSGRHQEAQQNLERALVMEAENPAVHERLGDLYKQSGKTEQARESYQKAVDYTAANDAASKEARQRKLRELTGGGEQRPRRRDNR